MSTPEFPAGPFTTRVAMEAGFSRRQLDSAVAREEVRRVLRGVYQRCDEEDSLTSRAAAAALVAPADSVVRDRFAAWIHGIDAFPMSERGSGPAVETCVLRGQSRSRRSGVRGRTRDLVESDVMQVGPVRVTTPLRTALDLGCNLTRRDAFAALVGLMREHGITKDELREESVRFFRRRGVVQLRHLLTLADPRLESPRECWTYLEIVDAGLPRPEPQWWIEVDGVPRWRLDFAYPDRRIAIEYDGEEFHDRDEDQRRADRERREWLVRHHWTVIVIRKGDFSSERLEAWLDELRAALLPAYTNVRQWLRPASGQ